MKKWINILVVIVLFFGTELSFGAELGKKELVLGTIFTSGGGKSSSEFFSLFDSLIDAFNENFPEEMKLKMKKYPVGDGMTDAFLKNEIDMGVFFSDQIMNIYSQGGAFYPVTTYTVDDRIKSSLCMWHKNDANVKSPKDLIGKTLIGANFNVFNLLLMRDFLYKTGIDQPMWKVFKSFTIVPSTNSATIALTVDEADLYFATDDGDLFYKALNPNIDSKIKHQFCTDRIFARGTVVLNKNTVTHEEYIHFRNSMKKFISNMKQYSKDYPTIKAGTEYMKLAKGKMIIADENEFEYEMSLYESAKKNHWLEEAEFIASNLNQNSMGKPVKVTADYNMCKQRCDKEKDFRTCLENCLE